jgi:hypothetical protein
MLQGAKTRFSLRTQGIPAECAQRNFDAKTHPLKRISLTCVW